MKQIRIAILLLLIPLCCVAFAALSKTTSKIEIDVWQKVDAGTLVVGNVGDISGSYDSFVYLEIVLADTDTNSGVPVKVEVSYGDDNWILLYKFTTEGTDEGASSTLDGNVSTGATVISLIAGGDFNDNGQKWFILNSGDVNKSESVRTKSSSTNDITLCHDTMSPFNTGETVWNVVIERIIPIPAAFANFRITIHNIDDDADIYFTTRQSEVEEL